MLDADRSPNAVSVHAGTSQVDFEVDCPPPASGTLTSGTGIPVVKPELSLDFA